MILRLFRTDGRKFTTHTVNTLAELFYIVVGFQVLGYLGITREIPPLSYHRFAYQ